MGVARDELALDGIIRAFRRLRVRVDEDARLDFCLHGGWSRRDASPRLESVESRVKKRADY
jgi:hypothetical protein